MHNNQLIFRYAVITAVYNAAPYLDDYFSSLLPKSAALADGSLEIICVDDGSTDDSAAIIHQWQRHYPGLIQYAWQENNGPASARNRGLELASAPWVTFMDADDFTHPRYLAEVDAFLASPKGTNVGMLVCNYQTFAEKNGAYRNAHPLSGRFAHGSRIIPAANTGDFVHVVTNSAFFLRDVLNKHGIRQKEDIRPTFEDGEMVIRYVRAIEGMNIGIVPEAVYYHRQRAEQTSLSATGYTEPDYFTVPLENGCLRLLRKLAAQSPDGKPPRFAQLTVLYTISQYFRRIQRDPALFANLPQAVRSHFRALLADIFSLLDDSFVEKASFPTAPDWFVPAVSALFKPALSRRMYISAEDYLPAEHELECRGFSFPAIRKEETEQLSAQSEARIQDQERDQENTQADCRMPLFQLDGQEILPVRAADTSFETLPGDASSRAVCHLYRIPVFSGASCLTLPCKNEIFMRRRDGAIQWQQQLDVPETIRELSAPPAIPKRSRSLKQQVFLRMATGPFIRNQYRHALLFSAVDSFADVHLEEAYRFLKRHGCKRKLYFVLQSDASRYSALRAENFSLISRRSYRHYAALLNCAYVLTTPGGEASAHALPENYKLTASYRCLTLPLPDASSNEFYALLNYFL